MEKSNKKEIGKNILENYKILKIFEEKDLFLVSKNEKKINYNYLLKRIEVKDESEKKEICKKINKYNLVHFEESEDDKIILYIFMKITKSFDIIRINEFIVKKEEDAWIIFIRLVIELNSLFNKNIKYNLKPNLIFIDDKNNVIINLIDLVLSEFYIKKDNNTDNIDNIYEEKDEIKEDKYENIKINIEKDSDEIAKIKSKEKIQGLFLGLFLLDLFNKKKLLKFFSKNIDILNLYSSEINDNINQIKNEELKIIFSKLLCEEKQRLSLSELILEKIFLKKVAELNLINELIDSETNIDIKFNSFPFFLSCNKCKIVPKIDLINNSSVLFSCPKCHIFESETIGNITNLNSKWIKYFNLKSSSFKESHEYILNLYKRLLYEKIDFIKENIKYIQSFRIDDNESRNLYYETIANMLTIFFENIKFGKNLVKLNIIFMKTIDKDINHINEEDISAKWFFDQEEREEEQNKKKEEPIRIKEFANIGMIQEKNSNDISFVDKRFNSSIEEQRDNFIILIDQQYENQKKIMKNYISNSFSNKYNEYNNSIQKKKNYIEDTIDFSRALNHFVVREKRKNLNNFIDINKTLEDFDDYSSTLNSKKHGEFILALLGKFLEENGTKVNILKEKDKELDDIELSSLQALFSLGTQRKYYIHFNLGETETYEILKNKSLQLKFLENYKNKISNILKIDINRIILKDVRFGCTQTTFSIVDQSNQEDGRIHRLKGGEIVEIEKRVMVDEQILSLDILDPKGDRAKGWGINEKRGGEKYIPPLDGWVGIGLKVRDKYENNKWLGYKNKEGEYSIAYYGLCNYLNDKDNMINDLNEFVSDIRGAISERSFQNEEDKRSGFLWFGKERCGGGVCLFQDPKLAECCAGIINIFGIEYKILLMCRVNPKKIRQPVNHEQFWILNPTPDEIRPYRILFKKVINSPLLDNRIVIDISPVDYIINAINSNDFSFYKIKTEERFNKDAYKDKKGRIFEDELFILRFYSSKYYKPLNIYMINGEILDTFIDSKGKKNNGFKKNELNSAICCLQTALKNKMNVQNGTVVYRGMSNKFDESINVGSQFYFSGFVSTSTSKKEAHRFRKSRLKEFRGEGKGTFMTITIQNNGTDEKHPNYCLNIEDISLSPKQKEILICSHCYFQVTNIQKIDDIDYVDLVCKGYLLDN